MQSLEPVTSLASSNTPWEGFEVRRRRPDLKRESVVQTAAHLFLEHGYRKTSMTSLAARLNITKPTLYYYFRNKEEILIECYKNGIAEIEGHLAFSTSQEGTGMERLQRYVYAYATVILTHYFGRCVARLDESELSAEARIAVRKMKRRVDLSIREIVNAGIADKSITPRDPKLVSFAVAGAINWIGAWYRPGGDLCPDDISREFTQMLTGGLDRVHKS